MAAELRSIITLRQQLTVVWCMLQPQLPANRDIVHLNIPVGNAGSALGRRLQDAAGEVNFLGWAPKCGSQAFWQACALQAAQIAAIPAGRVPL